MEKQVIAKATTAHMEEEAFAAKRRVLQGGGDELKRRKAGSTLELLKKQRNREATKLLIQPPRVSTLVKRMRAPRAPSATVKAKATLTGEAAPAEEYPSPRSAVKKPEATPKRRRQLPRSRLAALPAVPAKVNPLEAFGPLFGGKPKPAARVAKLAPVPKLTARRPRRQRRIRRHRSQWRPHPRRPRSSQRQQNEHLVLAAFSSIIQRPLHQQKPDIQ